MGTATTEARSLAPAYLRSRRLLALAADERLVEQVRRGNDAAFEVVFERHAPALLAFSRHMLGSREEAEDAVQLTFAAAHRDLLRQPERGVLLKPWLFTIARNRCLSMLRARREQPSELGELPTDGLAQQVEERAELRQLLADVRELPEEQRSALLLAEVSDLSHAQVADVLGCEVARVKALVFRARGGLMDRRRARATPCAEIQEQLANGGGGSLRRTPVRLHLRECSACRNYRDEVRKQRQLLALALPVAPTLGLKSSVLAAIGFGGGSAGGGIAAGLSSVAGALGSGALAKVTVVAVVAGGTAVAVPSIVDSRRQAQIPKADAVPQGADAVVARPSPGVAQRRPARASEPGPDARRPQDGSGEASRRSDPSLIRSASPKPTKRTTKSATAPGHPKKVQGRSTPPGQAKKSEGGTAPPGQAKRAESKPTPPGQAKTPPGQAKRTTTVPKGGGANSGNSGKAETPTQPPPKVSNPVPAAPPAADSGPAAAPEAKPKHEDDP